MQNIVGIDIGGSHITMAQVDPEKRNHFFNVHTGTCQFI
jgi:uncharacterized hydantoinase/oxoprolinase family protein